MIDADRNSGARRSLGVRVRRCVLTRVVVLSTLFTVTISSGVAAQTVKLNNRWKSDQFLSNGDGRALVTNVSTATATTWIIEPVQGTEFVRLKSGLGGYLHTEGGPLEIGSIQPGWHSAMWILEPVENFVRIRNRWRGTYIHVEQGRLEVGAIQPGWHSAMWVRQAKNAAPGPDRIQADRPPVRRAAATKYFVWVKTKDAIQAGTDANITIRVRGKFGEIGPIKLDKSGYDDFERGDEDLYELGFHDIGEVLAILLENDGSGAGADWHVDWVCVNLEHQPDCRRGGNFFRIDNWLKGNSSTVWLTPTN
ncbi:MAG: PLAT/LH2 domain-containing protein [Gemmatimonadota bacterium]